MTARVRVIQIVLILCSGFMFSQPSSLIYNASGSNSSLLGLSLNAYTQESWLHDRTLNLAFAALKHLSALQLASFFSHKRWSEDQILSN